MEKAADRTVNAGVDGWTPPVRDIVVQDFVWNGITIRVSFERQFLGRAESSPYNLSHVQIESIAPERAPLPFTGTGYRSHFINFDELKARGGPLAYVQSWLAQDAQLPEWKARSAGQQLSLF